MPGRNLPWYVSPAILRDNLAVLEAPMDEEIWKTGPSVGRVIERRVAEALTRNGVYATSALADEVRSRATIVWSPRCEPAVRVTDDRNLAVTPDAYIDEKKSNAAYASSFIPGSEKRISMNDEQALFGPDLGKVARGEIEVVDDASVRRAEFCVRTLGRIGSVGAVFIPDDAANHRGSRPLANYIARESLSGTLSFCA